MVENAGEENGVNRTVMFNQDSIKNAAAFRQLM